MGKFLFWVVILVIILNTWGSLGCLEEERVALLHVKTHIMNNTYINSLTLWVDDKSSDCCKWPRVTCSYITKRVIELDLYSVRYEQDANWYINATVFLPFKQLNYLSLIGNNLAGMIENGDGGELQKLEILDLRYNKFNESVFQWLKGLPSLKFLDLIMNNIHGKLQIQDINALSNLEILYLDDNYIEGFETSTSLSDGRRLTKLESLSLDDNRLNGSIFKSLKGFPSLKYLTLRRNDIHGQLYIQDINALSNLEKLNLGGNYIEGFETSTSLSNGRRLTKLESLSLDDNRLNGSIFKSLKGLHSLKHLSLSSNDIHGQLYIQDINALSNLEELNLDGNYIEGFETSTSLSDGRRLRKLERLSLYNNRFNGSIFKSLKWFPSLKFLDLSENDFQRSSLHIQDINVLSSLEDLDLSSNSFEDFDTSTSLSGVSSGIKNRCHLRLHLNNIICNMTKLLQSLATLPSIKSLELQEHNITSIGAIHALRNLSNLEELFLDNSYLHKDFLQYIGPMNSLKVLSASGAQLGGTLPNKGWCELRKLQELWLSENQLNGTLPPCLGNLTSLGLIDLAQNRFIGNIGSSPLSTLMSLKYLIISSNSFEVPSSFNSFYNHSKLRGIFADGNKVITDEIELQSLIPKFQLELFTMSNCIDLLKLPTFLHYQHDLKVFEISKNKLEGEFPYWLLQNNTKLIYFLMNSNAFTGVFKLPSHCNANMHIIGVSNNKLYGEIPNNLSSTFPNVEVLNLSYNLFEGQIPSNLGKLESLEFLDLSNNSLMGGIPKELLIGCSILRVLKLSNNKLEGEIFQEFVYMYSLQYLHLDGNNFSGTITDSLLNSNYLLSLDISDNKFSGKIPRWVGYKTSLEQLSLSKNHFEGYIPVELCNLTSLSILDLSENNLTGPIPSCLNPSSIKYVRLSKNQLGGRLTRAFFNNTALVILDLSYNDFVGKIPEWIGSVSKLSILLLKANRFEGNIPIQVCQLMKLSVLDLSDNQLTGMIPRCLGKLSLEVTDEKSIASSCDLHVSFELESYMSISESVRYENYMLIRNNDFIISVSTSNAPPEVEFATKGNLYNYEGNILKYMSGIDLSTNKLFGQIPFELGNLTEIRALNLSHNNFNGTIPETFSKLHNIESLDLSHNKLNGKIPNTLLKLYSLEVFSVAYNNLTGAIPEPNAQFGTFDERSYEGNPYLCGPPLQVSCNNTEPSSSLLPTNTNGESEEINGVDMEVFYISFGVSYVIFLLGIVLVLYINPYWRNTWFQLIEAIVCKWHG